LVAAEQWNAAPPRYSRPEEALRGDCPLSSRGKERKRKIERGRGRKGGGERESSRGGESGRRRGRDLGLAVIDTGDVVK
jgi:hypothetical protein